MYYKQIQPNGAVWYVVRYNLSLMTLRGFLCDKQLVFLFFYKVKHAGEPVDTYWRSAPAMQPVCLCWTAVQTTTSPVSRWRLTPVPCWVEELSGSSVWSFILAGAFSAGLCLWAHTVVFEALDEVNLAYTHHGIISITGLQCGKHMQYSSHAVFFWLSAYIL